ncbi:glycoside hydrolase family protein [Azospirillum formosense]|uniref:Lysozyme n=1 Tax=Azospirillum formosense TaxID=861533 RepID=A0ABX2KZ03_9PROT|nr:lysozyme [Azospirillum formosense]MBY3756707.1 lysozyme [Azospirillum formosense]NUB19787.1 glycoside hydrolase family protein [Azospirillum formosense]
MTTPAGAATPREIHDDALALVRHFEGLYLKAYLCPAGVPTIGYGHTAGVRMGQTITSLQAEVFLRADMADAAQDVDRLVKVPLTDRQRGALASFVFNLGAGALQSSTLLRLLNQGDCAGAAAEFPKWVYATVNGKKVRLDGLKRRRAAERALFEAG